MRTSIAFLLLAAAAWAQNEKPNQVKRLSSLTWDLNTHKLVWVVENGSEVGGQFVPSSKESYEISPDEASMAFAAEKRGFSETEAGNLQHLLDVLSLYCAESVAWWNAGEGVPISGKPGTQGGADRQKQPDKPKPAPPGKPTRIDQRQQQEQRKQNYHVRDGDLVADAVPQP